MRKLELIVNGRQTEVLVNENETLARVLRERLQLTGTKMGCEQGACGACTVWVQQSGETAVEPLLSCIAPAARYQGARITTIEGIASKGGLHPLQRKFVEKGAVQCGFCTPGMVMTALSHCEAHPDTDRQGIKEALAGNLCRCTGYKKIVDAVEEYAMEASGRQAPQAIDPDARFRMVGSGRPYIEAEKKVKGEAEYADDVFVRNALHCRFLRSPYPHARIKAIRTDKALAAPGVAAVLTGRDLPIAFGVLPISQDETAMAVEKTRYIGEIVAAVAADTIEQAEQAVKLIEVDYEPIDAFFEIADSLADCGTKERIHAHGRFNNNVHKKAELRFGDQQEGLTRSRHRIRQQFRFQGVTHAFTEPHAASAWWDENGLTIITATQVPHYLHRFLAKVMEVPMSRVRVIKPYVGGGFGGKSDPFPHEMIICQLARITGRPVRTRFSREEVFLTNHGRHPTEMTVELGIDGEGRFTALDAAIAIDGGAYGSFGVVTSYYNGVLLQAPYQLDNFGFVTHRVYTNKPQSGAMRGHGAVNSRFAVETLIDRLAEQAGMDPCDLRLKNFMGEHTLTVGQYRITSNGSALSLKSVRERSGWDQRRGKLPFGRGLGVGCGFFISGSALPIHWNEYPQSVVHLKLDLDGRVLVTSGASDIGQGSDTMLAMVVAETLGLSLDHVFVLAADTLLTPIDLGSYSSRVTFMAGNAAKMAAEELRRKVLEAVARVHEVPVEELHLERERVFTSDRKVDIAWADAVENATRKVGALNTSGWYNSPKLGGDFKGAGAGLSPSYSFGAMVAEVEVDPATGMVKVLHLWGAHDAGKAINPLAVEGQLEGSWHMGMGQALTEELRYHEGLLLNGNLLDYKIPTTLDTPDMHTEIIETSDPEGPFGAKECGEGALHPAIPAIVNAVHDAVGVRITSLPIRAEEILRALHARESAAANA